MLTFITFLKSEFLMIHLVHFAAHFGMSYAIADFTYRLSKSTFLAVGLAIIIGVLFKVYEIDPVYHVDFVRPMVENSLGIIVWLIAQLIY